VEIDSNVFWGAIVAVATFRAQKKIMLAVPVQGCALLPLLLPTI